VSPLQRATLWLATLACALTGAGYAWRTYLIEPADDFTSDPWAANSFALHLLVAPLLVFAVGWIFREHVQVRLEQSAERRPSGLALLALFLPMVASGYALSISADPLLRSALAWIHGISGALWTISFIVHAALFARRAL
jgi:hypothetical protein